MIGDGDEVDECGENDDCGEVFYNGDLVVWEKTKCRKTVKQFGVLSP